jgi:arabinogalactan oligomer/maltooligosaccharide transport system substrate-binding protein
LKKNLLVFLVVIVFIFSLAACSGANNDNTTETDAEPSNTTDTTKTEKTQATEAIDDLELVPEDGATLLVWESEGPEGEFLEYVGAEFEKKYGVPVKFESVGHTDAPVQLRTDGPAGLGADVFAAPHDHVGSMAAAGLILENFWPESYTADFMDAATTGTTIDGLLYGYPTGIETYGIFYHKDLVSDSDLPKTMDELINMSADYTDVSQNKYGIMAEVGNFYFMYAFIGGYGGYVFGDNNTDPTDVGLNNEGAVKAGHLMQRIKREALPLNSADISYDIKGSLFEEGKLMFDINGPWAVQGYNDAGVNFGVMPFPALENGQVPTSFSGIRALYVNAYTQFPDAASLFAQFATSEEMLVKRFEMTKQLPPHTALLNNPIIKNDEASAAFLAQAEYAVPMPNIPQMPVIWDPMGTALSIIWNEEKDPKEVLDQAVVQIKDAIEGQ